MAFDLEIAVKHAPLELPSHQGAGHSAHCRVTIIDVRGELTSDSSAALIRRLDDVVAQAATSAIIRFASDVRIAADDRGAIETIAAWITRRRHDGCNLYVQISDAAVRDVFTKVGEMKGLILPFGSDEFIPRCLVDDQVPGHEG